MTPDPKVTVPSDEEIARLARVALRLRENWADEREVDLVETLRQVRDRTREATLLWAVSQCEQNDRCTPRLRRAAGEVRK